jgi:hypothetical protein
VQNLSFVDRTEDLQSGGFIFLLDLRGPASAADPCRGLLAVQHGISFMRGSVCARAACVEVTLLL